MSVAIPIARYVTEEEGAQTLNLLVDGLHCPSCVMVIETGLAKQPEVTSARLNLSTRRLKIVWIGAAELGERWIALLQNMGYRAVAYDRDTLETQEKREEKFLLRCLAVAGFASGNLMLFSVPLWSSDTVAMGEATRTLFHWVQAIISIPAIAYCGLPFYRSAWAAVRQWRTNMDVPISVAVILATLMSVYETTTFGHHSYFDSAVMLLFFLLIGRYLEARARGRARSAAADLLQMMAGFATVLDELGKSRTIPLMEIQPGMTLLVAAGEKISADGEIIAGSSELDTSLITGETMARPVKVGDTVFAGTLNLGQPLTILATKAHEHSLMADIVRLMETAEQGQAKYVTLADRISGWYTPVVHILAAATFVGWEFFTDTPWQISLLYAATVLIITCPCALGLAVPVVQVIATGKLLRQGILLKSGSALERLASITHAIFDKTGTITQGRPTLLVAETPPEPSRLRLAASLAAQSKHPLARALSAAYDGPLLPMMAHEVKGCGIEAEGVRLGKRSWAAPAAPESSDSALEMWLATEGAPPTRFAFADQLRTDAAQVITTLQHAHIATMLLSGDRREVVEAVANQLGIGERLAEVNPAQKTQAITVLKQQGAQVLMVGDGLNDAPSLATATVSMSPTSAMDITQNAADIVFQGEGLSSVITAWRTARFAQELVRQNFALAILYNVFAIPMAVAGYVTPLVAAIAMSSSSLLVIGNAMRLNLKGVTR